jgi:hypothetical protein
MMSVIVVRHVQSRPSFFTFSPTGYMPLEKAFSLDRSGILFGAERSLKLLVMKPRTECVVITSHCP